MTTPIEPSTLVVGETLLSGRREYTLIDTTVDDFGCVAVRWIDRDGKTANAVVRIDQCRRPDPPPLVPADGADNAAPPTPNADEWFHRNDRCRDRPRVEVRLPQEVLAYRDSQRPDLYTWLRIGGVGFMLNRDDARLLGLTIAELVDDLDRRDATR